MCTDRQSQYGPVEDNFKIIADLWSVYLQKVANRKVVTSPQCGNSHVMLKIGPNVKRTTERAITLIDAVFMYCRKVKWMENKHIKSQSKNVGTVYTPYPEAPGGCRWSEGESPVEGWKANPER